MRVRRLTDVGAWAVVTSPAVRKPWVRQLPGAQTGRGRTGLPPETWLSRVVVKCVLTTTRPVDRNSPK